MSRQLNLDLAHRAWEAVAKGDIDTLRKVWAPDIVWHVTTDNPWAGDHVGMDAVLDFLADVGEAGEDYATRLDDALASDQRVLLVCHITARRNGRTVETDQLMLARVEDDRIVEIWTSPLSPKAFDGFYE